MASRTISHSSEGQVTPGSSEGETSEGETSEGECQAELVWLEVSKIDEILDFIVSSRQSGTESTICFHWHASQVDDLVEELDARLIELDQPKIRRFEYNYKYKKVYLDIMGESLVHYKVQSGLRDCIKNYIAKNPTINLAYERSKAIFRRARYRHYSTKFIAEVGDEENPYEEAEQRVREAEQRVTEAERRLAEERIEAERRVTELEQRPAEERNEECIEMERHIAAELERRMAVETACRVAAGRSEGG
ncbi:hypothetical protein N0V88_007420 [Collariella sp. IMI 366227]|nr:hypothetical protein N0V88_007420 [Collariella sp. IMI 366227]